MKTFLPSLEKASRDALKLLARPALQLRGITPPEPTATTIDYARYANDPMGLKQELWPRVTFYDKQIEIIESVRDNDETVIVAAHQLGKDFTAAFVVLWYFLTHTPCRVVTTSVKDDHLRVLWGEIGGFLGSSAEPLSHKEGGPLVINHREIRKVLPDGKVCPISYLIGMVSEKGEGLAGHHAPHALFVVDEASGVEDVAFDRAETWSTRRLVFGNAYGLNHWFHRAVKGGDVLAPEGQGS